jgi:putative flavoprotein involved in K+ transport
MGPDRPDAEALVLGAGPAGLGVAIELRRRGVEATVLERAPAVGASWRERYDALRLNSARWLSGMRAARIPRSAGLWPGRDDYVAYLEGAVERFGLDVRCRVEARRVDRAPGGYTVSTDQGELSARHVVVATGYDRVAHLPDWPGREGFAGELLHAAAYRRPEPFAGRDVLVVGAGNTGTEVATALARGGAARVRVALRTPPNIFPRELLGFPVQALGALMAHQPAALADRGGYLLQRLTWGDLRPYGLPRAPMGIATEVRVKGLGPVVDSGFVAELRAGRIEIVPALDAFDGADVVLADGSRVRPEAVIAATGYRHGLEDLVGHLGVLLPSGRPARVDGRAHPAAPGLHLNGYHLPLAGQLAAQRATSRRIARAVARQRRRARWAERARRVENRAYRALRHPRAGAAAAALPGPATLERLAASRHCLLISYRRTGEPVPTPVWFALDGDRLVFESDADAAKVRRLRRQPRVRVAPCSSRGRPLGAPVEAVARVLGPPEADAAERALDGRYGATRRLLTRLRPAPAAGVAYVEVVAAGA